MSFVVVVAPPIRTLTPEEQAQRAEAKEEERDRKEEEWIKRWRASPHPYEPPRTVYPVHDDILAKLRVDKQRLEAEGVEERFWAYLEANRPFANAGERLGDVHFTEEDLLTSLGRVNWSLVPGDHLYAEVIDGRDLDHLHNHIGDSPMWTVSGDIRWLRNVYERSQLSYQARQDYKWQEYPLEISFREKKAEVSRLRRLLSKQ